ncbi:uncharacterized protein DSM5745_01047 [Aspergillus mulundensis]|uniref:Uncharacterized protein n=1 Tax=Aspergillus mulundensis TaxID=1810919 RepID=A0A3D8T589_9EURO|nr:Uncharacterized protein DSM5745_01047 [Aspergillus mulundensis]RDW93725.1 Uncharacterized protein DSM5745_01047 [Aspergillus mulundensis]
MADRQHGLSRTLPKDFTYPSAEPRTPERASIQLDAPPPPPRHSGSRLRPSRVRSGTDLFAQVSHDFPFSSVAPDKPLPSIEFPPARDAPSLGYETGVPPDGHLLAPPRARVALKTPPAQIRPDPIEAESSRSWSTWNPQASGDEIRRPSSACSNASDSSVSSIETFSSRQSVGGSCTSAESDHYDPFFHIELTPKHTADTSPLPANPQKKHCKQTKTKERWTLDMDNHLWNTYQLYIQDPTITPFKMTPGSIPPLGVTHRVARQAKRTWERKSTRLDKQFTSAETSPRSGETTPTARDHAPKPSWLKSEASTRRRLKYLSKRKFSIAPHYQRMMQSRSPEPFPDLFSRPSDAPPAVSVPVNTSAAYATRDLGVSLVSSSVPGPLAQLAAQDPFAPSSTADFPRPQIPGTPRSELGTSLPAKSSSFDGSEVPRLGSPFSYHTWGPNNVRKRNQRHAPRARRETIHVTGSRLRSPPRMDPFPNLADSTSSSSNVPTEPATEEEETRRNLEELFRQGKLNDLGHRRVRIRARGATTSSAVTPKVLDQLFSPPSSSSRHEEASAAEKPMLNPIMSLSGEQIKRLGSPFKMEGYRRTAPPGRISRHAPSLSDPFASGALPRFRSLHQHAQHAPSRSQAPASGPPYDPTEAGISDAERIRRQILNMSYLRQ